MRPPSAARCSTGNGPGAWTSHARQRPGSTEGERNATKIVIEILRPTLEDVNREYFIHFVVVERKKEEIIWDTPVEFRDDVIEP